MPCSSQACAFLQYNKVSAIVPLHQINGRTHAGDTSANDNHSSIGVVFVPNGNFRVRFVACHCGIQQAVTGRSNEIESSRGRCKKSRKNSSKRMEHDASNPSLMDNATLIVCCGYRPRSGGCLYQTLKRRVKRPQLRQKQVRRETSITLTSLRPIVAPHAKPQGRKFDVLPILGPNPDRDVVRRRSEVDLAGMRGSRLAKRSPLWAVQAGRPSFPLDPANQFFLFFGRSIDSIAVPKLFVSRDIVLHSAADQAPPSKP